MRVVVAAGGTAGHLVPALEVARYLKTGGHEVSFLGVLGQSLGLLQEEGFSCRVLPARGLQGRGLWQDAAAAGSLARAAWSARTWLKRERPAVVVGFGGYGGFPGIMGAVMTGIPTVIHEQNVMPGRANQLLSRWVTKVAVSFPQSAAYFPRRKVVVTGCPIAPVSVKAAKREESLDPGFDPGRKTVLVFGGSQGSERINDLFPKCLPDLEGSVAVQVIHIAGRGKLDGLSEAYRPVRVPYRLWEYYRPMSELYEKADVVVCRAGAATVTELAAYRKRAVLIPYPFARAHQEFNARVLTGYGMARLLKDAEATGEELAKQLAELLLLPPQPDEFEAVRRELNINQATGSLAEEIESTV